MSVDTIMERFSVGVGRVWLHLFRHAAASRAAEAGASVREIQDLGGWSIPRMAERYTHARMERLRELLNARTHSSPTPQKGNPPGT